MRIIIQQNGTARILKGGFTLMGNKADLQSLGKQILQQADDDFYEGWIDIREDVYHPANTQPIEWEEKGPSPKSISR